MFGYTYCPMSSPSRAQFSFSCNEITTSELITILRKVFFFFLNSIQLFLIHPPEWMDAFVICMLCTHSRYTCFFPLVFVVTFDVYISYVCLCCFTCVPKRLTFYCDFWKVIQTKHRHTHANPVHAYANFIFIICIQTHSNHRESPYPFPYWNLLHIANDMRSSQRKKKTATVIISLSKNTNSTLGHHHHHNHNRGRRRHRFWFTVGCVSRIRNDE